MVIDKKLFSRAVKDKNSKTDDKVVLTKLDEEQARDLASIKAKLVDKLFILVNGKTSQGVMDIFKEFVYKMFL